MNIVEAAEVRTETVKELAQKADEFSEKATADAFRLEGALSGYGDVLRGLASIRAHYKRDLDEGAHTPEDHKDIMRVLERVDHLLANLKQKAEAGRVSMQGRAAMAKQFGDHCKRIFEGEQAKVSAFLEHVEAAQRGEVIDLGNRPPGVPPRSSLADRRRTFAKKGNGETSPDVEDDTEELLRMAAEEEKQETQPSAKPKARRKKRVDA